MNRTQRGILLATILLVAASCLFPPMSWLEVTPDPLGRAYVVDQQGIYHSGENFFLRRGLRFIGQIGDGEILWGTLATEWISILALSAVLLFVFRRRPSSIAPEEVGEQR